MVQQGPHLNSEQVTDPRLGRNTTNLTSSAKLFGAVGIPANISIHDSSYVAISGGKSLSDVLMPYYAAGVRRVEIIIEIEGQRLAAEAKIYRRTDKQSGRVYLWIYPLQPAQRLLREMLRRYRGDAAPKAKRPLPIAILAIMPKPN